MQARLQRGFVLHRRPYANTSLLLELFTAEDGRLAMVAKGAKRARSTQAALLQPFQPLWLGWTGRGEVKTLTRAEAAGRALSLIGTSLYCGFYVNELLMRLWPRQEAPESLFPAYQMVLEALSSSDSPDLGLRQFELSLLAAMGYALDLNRLADEDIAVRSEEHYVLYPEQGLRRALAAGPESVSGETLGRLVRGEALEPRHRREAKTLLRRALAPHLGNKPLRSRELFRALPGQGAAAENASAGHADGSLRSPPQSAEQPASQAIHGESNHA
ncbi:DNA repair protein RecO [Thiorhodovibrio frisius]|uniref:DNA repair protein RecO n=1 Tax=Thiorhodovibrio frisius TaxID=631362 RepID=H8Z271_9GAMM|nr:DNA repair protein RecO [Thiorhodovibrio frisius]EIC22633.1 DNA repair protein RecO [Thiorhodovibrio frisius]WPL22389.1 Recombination protein O [Thiorhodovibrio frisius]